MYKKSEIPGKGTGKTGKNIFCTCTFGKNLVAKQEKTYFVHFCTCTFGKNLVAKQEKTYFVHFCTCTFGKNLVAMYKNVVGPPPP